MFGVIKPALRIQITNIRGVIPDTLKGLGFNREYALKEKKKKEKQINNKMAVGDSYQMNRANSIVFLRDMF